MDDRRSKPLMGPLSEVALHTRPLRAPAHISTASRVLRVREIRSGLRFVDERVQRLKAPQIVHVAAVIVQDAAKP